MSRASAPGAALAALLAAGSLSACGGEQPGSSPSPGSLSGSASNRVSGKVIVFAAASLKETFTQLAKDFERANPGTDVVLSFGPSSGLATQITQGAPADVFASASVKNMTQVVKAGDASGPKTFARNQLSIVTPPNNPGKVAGLADLAKPSVKTALCQQQVPCGTVANKVFSNAGVKVQPVTQEVDVKAVLSKVRLGEVDAGLVYVTDAKAAGSAVRTVPIAASDNASTDYPIARTAATKNPAAATAFVNLVLSKAGRDVLARAGFAAPS